MTPPHFAKLNQPGASEHAAFITKSVEEGLLAGAMMKWPRKPKVVNPLNVVPKKNGGLRLIVDMRHVNSFLQTPKFKLENLQQASSQSQQGDWMFSIDLAQAYWQVDMDPAAYEYLGFEWQGNFYVFKVLPFGLSTAPWAFTKVMKEVVCFLRARGISLIAYLDDFLFFLRPIQQSATFIQNLVLHTFSAAGFLINAAKSNLKFVTRLAHLGFTLDTVAGVFEATPSRWATLQQLVQDALRTSFTTAKTMAMISGHIVSLQLALGPTARMFTREMYRIINNRQFWNSKVAMSLQLRCELCFWQGKQCNTYTMSIWRAATIKQVQLNTDASGTAWGAVLGKLTAHSYFTIEQRKTSSTSRELLAVQGAMRAFVTQLSGQSVQLLTDNQNVASILGVGSKRADLHSIALSVFWLALEHNILLSAAWIPRGENQQADAMSKWIDREDWKLNPRFFFPLDRMWGPHSIDRFASHLNHQVPTFNSMHWCPGTHGVDCFAQSDWATHNNWCNPPFSMIGALLEILRAQAATATVIIPMWVGQPWWASIVLSSQQFAGCVHACKEVPRSGDTFLPGAYNGNLAGIGSPAWRVLALRVSFKADSPCGTVRIPT